MTIADEPDYHVLIVDDIRELQLPDRVPTSQGWRSVKTTYARTSREAISLLELNTYLYNEIWMDYDLGGDDTALPVIDWVAEHTFFGGKLPSKFILHTDDPVGRDTMHTVLTRWEYEVHDVNAADHLKRD